MTSPIHQPTPEEATRNWKNHNTTTTNPSNHHSRAPSSSSSSSSSSDSSSDSSESCSLSPPSRPNEYFPFLPVPLSSLTIAHLFSGAAARFTGACLTSPLDTIKTRLQFQQRATIVKTPIKQYRNAWDAFVTIYRTESIGSFYRGLPARLFYVTPASAISFVFYEQYRVLFQRYIKQRRINSNHKKNGNGNGNGNGREREKRVEREVEKEKNGGSSLFLLSIPLLMGGLARFVGTAIRTPFDVIRQRMQVQRSIDISTVIHSTHPSTASVSRPARVRGQYANTFDAFRNVFQLEGLKAFWSGFGATILRDVPFGMIYFMAYEAAKTVQTSMIQNQNNQEIESANHFPTPSSSSSPTSSFPSSSSSRRLHSPHFLLSGAFAAGCAVVLTMPFDVCKTRLQTQGSLISDVDRKYRGVTQTLHLVWKEEGIRGLWKGTGARLMYLCPSAAITFTLYEKYKQWIGQYWFKNQTI